VFALLIVLNATYLSDRSAMIRWLVNRQRSAGATMSWKLTTFVLALGAGVLLVTSQGIVELLA
jgi:hypothetical protein